jgi:hypothetical protein
MSHGSPDVSARPLPRSRVSCCSPLVPCVSGAHDQVSDDEVPIPCLHVTSLVHLLVLLLPCLPTVIMKFLFHGSHNVLLWFHVMVMLRFHSCSPAFLAFAPPPPLILSAVRV